jgi:hypothetical protein
MRARNARRDDRGQQLATAGLPTADRRPLILGGDVVVAAFAGLYVLIAEVGVGGDG